MLTVERLRMSFGPVVALEDVSFIAPEGIVAIAGPNGAGKSTLMRILSGSLTPERGRVVIDGVDASLEPIRARSLTGAVFENAPVYRGMTVEEYLRFAARARGLSAKEARTRAARSIATCGLSGVQTRLTDGLSRGYRQRTAFAAALSHEPTLLVLDEPSSGLDPVQIADFWALVKGFSAGRTVLISTHNMSEIERLEAFVVLMNRGSVIRSGSVSEILSSAGAEKLDEAFASLVIGDRSRE